jgi:hypothetical protein
MTRLLSSSALVLYEGIVIRLGELILNAYAGRLSQDARFKDEMTCGRKSRYLEKEMFGSAIRRACSPGSGNVRLGLPTSLAVQER